jgi:hypothetical protein
MSCDDGRPCKSCALAAHVPAITRYLQSGRRFSDVAEADLVKVWSRMLAGHAVFRLEPLDLEAVSSECLIRARPACTRLQEIMAKLRIPDPA